MCRSRDCSVGQAKVLIMGDAETQITGLQITNCPPEIIISTIRFITGISERIFEAGWSSSFALKENFSRWDSQPSAERKKVRRWGCFSLGGRDGALCCSVNHFLWNHHLNLHRYATVVNRLVSLSPCPAPRPLFPKKRPCPRLPSSENPEGD